MVWAWPKRTSLDIPGSNKPRDVPSQRLMGVGARDDNLLFIESMNADCLPLRVCRFAVSLEHNCLRYARLLLRARDASCF